MSRLTSDPLLSIARFLVIALMAVMGIAAVATVIAAPIVLVMHDHVLVEIASETGRNVPPQVVGAIVAVLLCAALALALTFFALRLLLRVVDSVAVGDPFVPANGKRLIRMAWLMFTVQIVQIPLFGVGTWLATALKEGHEDVHFAVDLDFSALVLVLILVVLARVFRKGAEMREELEGTV